MSLIIRKKSGIVLKKPGRSPFSFQTHEGEMDLWLNEVVVRSVTETVLKLPLGSLESSSHDIHFYPVWTMSHQTKEKIVKKIAVKLSCDENYKFIEDVSLKDFGLVNYDELLECFRLSNAIRKRDGIKDFYKRYRLN